MKRSRRIAVTIAAATGVLGGAGAAVMAVDATVVPLTQPELAPVAAGTGTGSATAAHEELAGYAATMTAREAALERRLDAASNRLHHAEAVRAARVAQAREAEAEAERVAAAGPTRTSTAPATHTATGASGSGGHEDDEHGEHDEDDEDDEHGERGDD